MVAKNCGTSSYTEGDFNVDALSRQATNVSFISMLPGLGYFLCNSKPTRIVKDTSTLFDHVYANQFLFDVIIDNSHSYISDHNLLLCQIVLPSRGNSQSNINKEVRHINYDQLRSYLFENPVYINSENVDELYDGFRDHITHALNVSTISKQITSKNDGGKSCALWIDKDLKRLCKRKQVLFGKVKARPGNQL